MFYTDFFKACFEDFNRSKPSLVKHFFCNNSLKTNLTQHLMFQWIRRTSYATYFTFTGSYVDFSFWVLRWRHNIMPTRFLTLLRWSRMHHNLSVAFKRTYLSWIEKKTYVLWKLLTDTWYQRRWIIPICDGNKKKASVVTDRLHTGGDHIVVTQRNWSNFFQQSNCCSVNSALYNSVPIQRLNIKSKTSLIKILQLTYEKENKPGQNRVSPSWRQSENDASFPYLKIAAFAGEPIKLQHFSHPQVFSALLCHDLYTILIGQFIEQLDQSDSSRYLPFSLFPKWRLCMRFPFMF